MDIWTERLRQDHLPLLERWVGRTDGAVTVNDLPRQADALAAWLRLSAAEPGRQDHLITVYETPVGIAGFRRGADADTAALYLLLGEVQYNLLRTATYAVQRVLDHAFGTAGYSSAAMRIHARYEKLLAAFERMGFVRKAGADGETVFLTIDKNTFLARKYLF